ncbi:hypothetical protein ACTMU2_18940 [Cupriavidus basilensis]
MQVPARLAAAMGDTPVDIIHVGGEILTCSAWEAAVRCSPASEAQALVVLALRCAACGTCRVGERAAGTAPTLRPAR